MLESSSQVIDNNTRNPSMTAISKEDFENVSLFAHHIGLKALFDVLASHNPTLAADVAMELQQVKPVLPQMLPDNLHPHVNHQLQKWIDQLHTTERPES